MIDTSPFKTDKGIFHGSSRDYKRQMLRGRLQSFPGREGKVGGPWGHGSSFLIRMNFGAGSSVNIQRADSKVSRHRGGAQVRVGLGGSSALMAQSVGTVFYTEEDESLSTLHPQTLAPFVRDCAPTTSR